MEKEQKKKNKSHEKPQYQWILRVFFMSVTLSAGLSLLSESALEGAGLWVALGVLFMFILLGIMFDIVGVAVTAADERPFHSMASHKEKGASEALHLIRNSSHVSSFCDDVVGDICGIVSGTTAAVIVARVLQLLPLNALAVSVGLTALISGLTIGGKALGKTFAIKNSTKVVFAVGRFMHLFHRP